MHGARHFLGERLVNHALARQAGLIPEGRGHQFDAEMRLAAGPCAGMTGMQVGFVDDIEMQGREFRLQLPSNMPSNAHGDNTRGGPADT